MTHDEAKKSMAAEAYILDDLEAAERNAFEEHFFDCTDCTSDVLDAAKIADGIRTGTNVVPFRHNSRWAAAAAAAAVAIGLAYNYVPQAATEYLPNLAARLHIYSAPIGDSARVAPDAQPIELDSARAGATTYKIRADRPVAVNFDIQQDPTQPPYVCVLKDEAGRVLASKNVQTKEEAGKHLAIPLAAGKLHSGSYTLAIRGEGPEIPPYHFTVEVQ
jgi:hypothetical protein